MMLRALSKFLPCTVGLCLVTLAGGCGSDDSGDQGLAAATALAVRRPLVVTVLEGGDLASNDPHVIRSQVEGEATITFLAPEGSKIKKGGLVAELARSEIEDDLNREESAVTLARSTVEQARSIVEIQEKLNDEKLITVETDLTAAVAALQAYEEGIYPLDERQLLSEEIIAKEQLARAEERARASERLFEDKFVSKTEMQADQLAHKQASENVEIVQGQLGKLRTYTQAEELKVRGTRIAVLRLNLERVRQENESRLRQRKLALKTASDDYRLRLERRDKLKTQLAGTRIYAPVDGLVVYARRRGSRYGGDEPISVGRDVREREEIMRIPDVENLHVDLDIHETSVKKIVVGQRARVTVDALPGRVLLGTVSEISPVSSSSSSFVNSDLKVYSATVQVDQILEGLKPGMHAQVEVIVRQVPDALQVPLTAVRISGRRTYVYVKESGATALREVEIGDHGVDGVEIVKGLSAGEVVYLQRPDGGPELPAAESLPFLDPREEAGRGREANVEPGERRRRGRRDGGEGRGAREGQGLPNGRAGVERGGSESGPGDGDGEREGAEGRRRRFDPSNLTPEQRERFEQRRRQRREQGGGEPGGPPRGERRGAEKPQDPAGGSEVTPPPAPSPGR